MRQTYPLFAAGIAILTVAGAAIANAPVTAPQDKAIEAAVGHPGRVAANRTRDQYRHPVETLRFFGAKPTQTIVEIWPGGGWYTQILAPLTQGKGAYYVVGPNPDSLRTVRAFGVADKDTFGHLKEAIFPAFAPTDTRVPDGSVDLVLTFRNVHNWRMGSQRPDKQDYSPEAFKQMFAMLKKRGTLGIVDHRLPESASAERERSSGYIKVSTIKKLAADAGFKFVASSEVNANPKDPADWPNGVWTLPPTLSQKEVGRDKYIAIGESDRMTLKFIKP
ncbi:MAG: methyltransferase [Sphingomonadales bacterium]|nr:MAG: methyltransferase [Sphingomonadales bacterium]